MQLTRSSTTSKSFISRPVAIGAVLVLWVSYTILQTLSVTGHISDSWMAVLGFVPGLTGVAVLTAAGLARDDLCLRVASLSAKGFAVLAAIFVFALAAIVPFGTWQGWNWTVALVYAPASGISQELFFRSVLLPAFLLALPLRGRLALILHSLLFGLWHIGPLFLGAPLSVVLAVMLVPFIAGIGWGWQVRRDGTVIWAMVQHSLIWVVAGQFPIPE